MRLSNRVARHLFLDRHALAETPCGPARGGDLAALIDRLGFVQLDSVNTLARAHDMILFSRRPAYRPKNLRHLYDRDRALFEHWTHDAAVIPMGFYPHWHLRFSRDAKTLQARWKSWRRGDFEARCKPVLSHIRENGPAMASDLGDGEKKGSGGWWDWHPSKTALEYLWRTGVLTVIGRIGFQKQYDLTERVIENHLRTDCPDPDTSINWLCNGALDRLGFATPGEIASFWDTVTPAEAKAWCTREEARGALIAAVVDTAQGSDRKVYLRPETLETLDDLPALSGRMRVLSPFDPALRDRPRAERLFGFHYRIEIFVPAAKRRYGYYVFPLLEGDRLVGRIDMKANRDADAVEVTALWPEPGVNWGKGRQARLSAELERVARFAGLAQVRYERGWLRPAA